MFCLYQSRVEASLLMRLTLDGMCFLFSMRNNFDSYIEEGDLDDVRSTVGRGV